MIGRYIALQARPFSSWALAIMGVLAASAAAAPNAIAADLRSTQASQPGSAPVSSRLSSYPDAQLPGPGFAYVLGHAKQEGRKFRVPVSPRRALRLVIPRVARISAPKHTFRRKGVMVVKGVKAHMRKGLHSALRPAGSGIDVRFREPKLRRPLTVAYRISKPPKDFKPRYIHITDSGAWELEQDAQLQRGKWLVVRTKSFSSIVPGWLRPSAWWDTIGDWARGAGRWASKAIGGRTDPLGSCGPPPPGWFSYSQGTDLVHTCTIDNAGRAEIQIKSNRGVAMVVTVPGNPAYVWVEDRPAWVRNMQARLWSDPDRHVLLGPGQRMAVGYTQPPADFQGSFSVNLEDPRAWLDNLIRGAVDLVGDAPAAALITYTMTRCFSGAELGASTARLSPSVSIDKAGCMFQALLELANDPERALQIVVGFGGNKGDAADLLRKARSLSVIAKALSVLGPVKNLALRAIDDSMRALFNDGNARIFVRLARGQDGGSGSEELGFSGTFRAVAVDYSLCAIPTTGGVSCWFAPGEQPPSTGDFTAIVRGTSHGCVLTRSGEAVCWVRSDLGYDVGQATPPGGPFVKLAAGQQHTCGLRPHGAIECSGGDFVGPALT